MELGNGNPLIDILADGVHPNDIISLRLDLKKREFRIFINDKDQGIAYNGQNINIDDDIEYRLAITMCDSGDCVEIINFMCSG